MADIKTVQLIVNSEQAKNCIRTAFEWYSNRLHLKRNGNFSVWRDTIGMENLAIKNHKTLHNAIWKNSGPMQPCMEPFGKNMDAANVRGAIWKKYGPMQPCMEPFEKNMDATTVRGAIWKKYGPMQTCGAPDFSKMVFYKQRRCYISFTWYNTDGFLRNSL